MKAGQAGRNLGAAKSRTWTFHMSRRRKGGGGGSKRRIPPPPPPCYTGTKAATGRKFECHPSASRAILREPFDKEDELVVANWEGHTHTRCVL